MRFYLVENPFIIRIKVHETVVIMDLVTLFAIILFLVVAIIFCPLGLGGGVLYVPIFHYVLDWDFQESLIGSLTLVLMVTLGSGLAHSKTGNANNKIANSGRITAIPSAVFGTILSGVIINYIGDAAIKLLAIIILLFVVDRTLKKMKDADEITTSNKTYSPEVIKQYQLGTAFAGVSSGLLGIGGGAILVTLNRNLLKMDSRESSGTSYLVAATIVPVALLSHLFLDGVASEIIASSGWLAIITIPLIVSLAAFSGAKFAIDHIPKGVVTKVFLAAVSLGIIRYIYDLISIVSFYIGVL